MYELEQLEKQTISVTLASLKTKHCITYTVTFGILYGIKTNIL